MQSGWIGFDLDGTLAFYDGWQGNESIGRPIPEMVELVKKFLEAGVRVKILTARAHDPNAVPWIHEWCKEHIGEVLEVTTSKDYGMILLYDDRCVQIITNTGRRADGKPLLRRKGPFF